VIGMKIKFCDLKAINKQYGIDTSVFDEVLDTGNYLLGKQTEQFESNITKFLSNEDKTGYTITCANGTDALILSLKAVDISIGDEVITVANTAYPTISAILNVGATPKFIDIDPQTLLMDINQLELILSPKTKAIMIVHLYGNMVAVELVKDLLRKVNREDIIIIEDVAQAFGSKINGCSAGTLSDLAAFSFYPTKNLGALGDAGAVYTTNDEYAKKIRALKHYGMTGLCLHYHQGINSRIDELQAAVLNQKIKLISSVVQKKELLYDRYQKGLRGSPYEMVMQTKNAHPHWHLLVIMARSGKIRDDLRQWLSQCGIETLIHYSYTVANLKFLASDQMAHLPQTLEASERILSLPFNIALQESDIDYIVDCIKRFD